MNDGDGNGWSNTADQTNGGTSPIQTTDGNNDGYPDVYTTGDFEADVHPNFLDIDADNSVHDYSFIPVAFSTAWFNSDQVLCKSLRNVSPNGVIE